MAIEFMSVTAIDAASAVAGAGADPLVISHVSGITFFQWLSYFWNFPAIETMTFGGLRFQNSSMSLHMFSTFAEGFTVTYCTTMYKSTTGAIFNFLPGNVW